MSEVTVSALKAKVDEFLNLKAEIKDLESRVSDRNKLLRPIAQVLIEIMDALELDNFAGSMGKVSKIKTDYVSNPATDEDKQAFQEYLKAQGIFDEMVSVHNARLNSYFKSELELAISEGRELNIPGLEPKQRVEIRKSR